LAAKAAERERSKVFDGQQVHLQKAILDRKLENDGCLDLGDFLSMSETDFQRNPTYRRLYDVKDS